MKNLRHRIEHAVLWQGGKMLDLTPRRSSHRSTATAMAAEPATPPGDAINARGQVMVSMTSNLSGNLHIDRAFLWQNGKLILPLAPTRIRVGRIYTAVGGWDQRPRPGRRFRQHGAMRPRTRTTYSLVHAFVWQNGKMTDRGTLPRKLESEASSINERGEITRQERRELVSEGGIGAHCVVWQKGKVSDVGVAGGECFAGQINDLGQIVGWHEHGAPAMSTVRSCGRTAT